MKMTAKPPNDVVGGNANLQYEKMQLSDLQRNEVSRKKGSKYIKLKSGKRTLHFDEEKMEPIKAEFTRYQCALEKYIGGSS